ncbi:uncharacterized protein N7469_008626 [Penicillium citrinum]|uniref:Uncharacterized protein n=1 Tax=Penicillium citrinum TaxID=5077 RepID=A0A9W9NM47_PENCI|nr:uncharacterized protein N7469_008626 [Penicillium citrinum]KAJ5222386.1 hypothetical protein N7469_008626 [Penicillium citrinum]
MIIPNDALRVLATVAAIMLLGLVYSFLGHLVKYLSDLCLPQCPSENLKDADATSDDDDFDLDIFLLSFERTLERLSKESKLAE